MKRLFLLPLLLLSGCSKPQRAPGFDIPAVLTANFETAQTVLGAPSYTSLSPTTTGAGRNATWDDGNENSLVIIYSGTTKKPTKLYLTVASAMSDKTTVLKVGHLSSHDAHYKLQFLENHNSASQFGGVTVLPLSNPADVKRTKPAPKTPTKK